jgi:zinc protease
MRTEPVSESELHQAKALLLRQIPLSTASEDAVAGALLARAQMGLPLDEPVNAAHKYLTLTAEDVQKAFERQIKTGNLVQIVRGPAPQ